MRMPENHSLTAPLAACVEGRLAPNVALMHLLADAPDEKAARNALQEFSHASSGDTAERLAEVQALWGDLPELFSVLKRIVALAESGATSATDWARIFDRAAAANPEASVALYSLGSPELLARITDELVGRMVEWELFAPDFRVLDLGCGTGRIANAIAQQVRSVLALDCSEMMAQLARSAAADLDNVCVVRAAGDNLAFLHHAVFDTVLAIDSFPYLVQSQLAEAQLAEIARVLKADGRLLIMNYSYRGDLARDRADIAQFAALSGFTVLRHGTSDLTLWDGRAFLLRKA